MTTAATMTTATAATALIGLALVAGNGFLDCHEAPAPRLRPLSGSLAFQCSSIAQEAGALEGRLAGKELGALLLGASW